MAFSTLSIFPTIPITGVGLIGVISLSLFFDSLYRETFPPVTGVSKALHASANPLHEDESCQYPISFSGEEKFKLFVIATGSAPTPVSYTHLTLPTIYSV